VQECQVSDLFQMHSRDSNRYAVRQKCLPKFLAVVHDLGSTTVGYWPVGDGRLATLNMRRKRSMLVPIKKGANEAALHSPKARDHGIAMERDTLRTKPYAKSIGAKRANKTALVVPPIQRSDSSKFQRLIGNTPSCGTNAITDQTKIASPDVVYES
jgi:hypothetical protein